MKCETCGQKNTPGEISCQNCGRMLPLERSGEGSDPLIGTSYEAQPDDNFMQMYAARGRRFLLVFAMMFAIILGLGALPLLLQPATGPKIPIDPEMLKLSRLGVGLFTLVFVAFLIGKTGESVGTPFAVNFILALIPPLWPAVLARIAGRKLWIPYVYMFVTLAAYCAIAWFAADYAYVTGGLFLLILPLLIYQLLGCSISEIGPALGYGPVVSFLWLCVAPVVLFVMLLNSIGYSWFEIISIVDVNNLATSLTTLAGNITPTAVLNFSSISVAIGMFALLTHLLWIRSVYQNLCYPQLE